VSTCSDFWIMFLRSLCASLPRRMRRRATSSAGQFHVGSPLPKRGSREHDTSSRPVFVRSSHLDQLGPWFQLQSTARRLSAADRFRSANPYAFAACDRINDRCAATRRLIRHRRRPQQARIVHPNRIATRRPKTNRRGICYRHGFTLRQAASPSDIRTLTSDLFLKPCRSS